MKSNYYHKLLVNCKTQSEFESALDKTLRELVSETESLIRKRVAKTNDSIISCVNDINQKWTHIVELYDRDKDILHIKSPDMPSNTLLIDGFKSAFVILHPEYSFVFNLDSHKKYVLEQNAKIEEEKNFIKNYVPHRLTPFEGLTMDNISEEILACLSSLSGAKKCGISIGCLKPLADRISLLKYWRNNGSINLDDVKEFNKNPTEFLRKVGAI